MEYAAYNDGTGKWHTYYMESVKRKSNASLRCIITDCNAAMSSNPSNPKCGQYADELLYCAQELHHRARFYK